MLKLVKTQFSLLFFLQKLSIQESSQPNESVMEESEGTWKNMNTKQKNVKQNGNENICDMQTQTYMRVSTITSGS